MQDHLQRELPPVEDKIQQVMKFLEIADISQFNGKNVFEAGDADTLHDILETAFKQEEERLLSTVREMVERDFGFLFKDLQEDIGEPKRFDLYAVRAVYRDLLSLLTPSSKEE